MKNISITKSSYIIPSDSSEWEQEIPKAMRRRSPRIWRMAQVVATRIIKEGEYEIKPNSIIVATALGALDETVGFLTGSFTDGFGSPRNFIASVHNSMAGKIAMNFKVNGPNLTICDSHNSLASAILSAELLNESDFPILLIAVDEKTELLSKLNSSFSDECQKYLPKDWQEGAAAFLLELTDDTDGVIVSATAPQPVGSLPIKKISESVINTMRNSGINMQNLNDSSNSFVAPAFSIAKIIENKKKGTYGICSYSPTAKTFATIKLNIN